MKTLPPIIPTSEQLPIISDVRLGIEVIRGAAGSGKTSTALLRLKSLCYTFEERRQRMGDPRPISVLVLTFNRTLAGYVRALAEDQLHDLKQSILRIETFANWAFSIIGNPRIVSDPNRDRMLSNLSKGFAYEPSFIAREVDYLLGRFPAANLTSYVSEERTGRGLLPSVPRTIRRRILDEIVIPYKQWLSTNGFLDWNDIPNDLLQKPSLGIDIVIVDESQDFSANQLRAVKHHLAKDHAVAFVIDTMQRIYPRGFSWTEIGFDMRTARYHKLMDNHRNTTEIATFAAGILHGVPAEDDGALPNLSGTLRTGAKPIVLVGLYNKQTAWAIDFIKRHSAADQSFAFLQPFGGGYFDFLKSQLSNANIAFSDLTKNSNWPDSGVQIGLCTFHSAKGLEFDYVFILGLNRENTNHGSESEDDYYIVLRRLLAVAVARARKGVVVGYKATEASLLIQNFVTGTFDEIRL